MLDSNKLYTFLCVIDGRKVRLENKSVSWMKDVVNYHNRVKMSYKKIYIVVEKKMVDVTSEIKA